MVHRLPDRVSNIANYANLGTETSVHNRLSTGKLRVISGLIHIVYQRHEPYGASCELTKIVAPLSKV